jgi:hypothetical protein
MTRTLAPVRYVVPRYPDLFYSEVQIFCLGFTWSIYSIVFVSIHALGAYSAFLLQIIPRTLRSSW